MLLPLSHSFRIKTRPKVFFLREKAHKKQDDAKVQKRKDYWEKNNLKTIKL